MTNAKKEQKRLLRSVLQSSLLLITNDVLKAIKKKYAERETTTAILFFSRVETQRNEAAIQFQTITDTNWRKLGD